MKDYLTTEQQDKIIKTLLKKPQNQLCSDCNGKTPCWVSLDFGVFICMNCSGAHRALGPSITRVKSITLDSWNRNWVQNMKIGNSIINQYWQYQLESFNKKPNVNTSLQDIKKYVVQKYIKKKFINFNQQLDPLTKYKKGIPITSSKSIKIINQSNQNIQANNKPTSNTKIIPQKVVKENTINIQKKIQQPQFQQLVNKPTNSQKKVELIDFQQDFNKLTNLSNIKNQPLNNYVNNPVNNPVNFQNFLSNISTQQVRNNTHINHQNERIHANYFVSQQNGFANVNHISHPHGFSLPSHQQHAPVHNHVPNITQTFIQNPSFNNSANLNLNLQPNLYNNPNMIGQQNNNSQKPYEFNDFFTNNMNGPSKMNNITLQVTLNSDKKLQNKESKNWIDDWM